jgi:hypothetical protein
MLVEILSHRPWWAPYAVMVSGFVYLFCVVHLVIDYCKDRKEQADGQS